MDFFLVCHLYCFTENGLELALGYKYLIAFRTCCIIPKYSKYGRKIGFAIVLVFILSNEEYVSVGLRWSLIVPLFFGSMFWNLKFSVEGSYFTVSSLTEVVTSVHCRKP